MAYINDKISSLDYYQLTELLSVLEKDKKKYYFFGLLNAPEHLVSLISLVKEKQFKMAELIPTEKLLNDLNYFNHIVKSN